VLLILTDGEIHDMSRVKNLIVNSSRLPTSIIIVGVGNEQFELMEDLDSDDQLLRDDMGN
jgi:copine 1/2/3